MAKIIFSTDKRAERILQSMRNENVCDYINNAVLDEALPLFSELRIYALHLLDLITVDTKDRDGNKLIGEDEIEIYTRQILSQGIGWLGHNHHIKRCDILSDIITHFNLGPWTGGVIMEDVNQNVRQEVDIVRNKLKDINHKYNDFHVGLGSMGRDVLEHWEHLWNWDNSYDLIMSVVTCENSLKKIDPFLAIKLLRAMEDQFIIENI